VHKTKVNSEIRMLEKFIYDTFELEKFISNTSKNEPDYDRLFNTLMKHLMAIEKYIMKLEKAEWARIVNKIHKTSRVEDE